jgi:hypothetical protein
MHSLDELGLVTIIAVKHEEATTAGSDQLATSGAVFSGNLIAFIDKGVGHFPGALFLGLPMLMEEFS